MFTEAGREGTKAACAESEDHGDGEQDDCSSDAESYAEPDTAGRAKRGRGRGDAAVLHYRRPHNAVSVPVERTAVRTLLNMASLSNKRANMAQSDSLEDD